MRTSLSHLHFTFYFFNLHTFIRTDFLESLQKFIEFFSLQSCVLSIKRKRAARQSVSNKLNPGMKKQFDISL